MTKGCMMRIEPEAHQGFIKTTSYWLVLFVTLVVMDDAVFGWIFWLLSQVNPFLSAIAALSIYWVIGYWLTLRGLKPQPGKVASWLLSRLKLERKSRELNRREPLLQDKFSFVAAVPMVLIVGGVIATLWLYRRNLISEQRARILGFWFAGIYALEFALVHALGIGGAILLFRQ